MNIDSFEIRELYQELIIDHGTKPKNFRKMENPNTQAEGYNPLCGDRIELFLKILDGKIIEASFQGQGCAISTASASLMTEALIGKTETEARSLFQNFKDLLMKEELHPEQNTNKKCQTKNDETHVTTLGKLIALQGVRAFPTRIKCATLPWHTLNAALETKIQGQDTRTPILCDQ